MWIVSDVSMTSVLNWWSHRKCLSRKKNRQTVFFSSSTAVSCLICNYYLLATVSISQSKLKHIGIGNTTTEFIYFSVWKIKRLEVGKFRVYSLERLGLEWRVFKDDSRQNIKVGFNLAFIFTGFYLPQCRSLSLFLDDFDASSFHMHTSRAFTHTHTDSHESKQTNKQEIYSFMFNHRDDNRNLIFDEER